ncbi:MULTISPECIES: glycosyltransferase family 4 protein [Flavobacteriaceae]|uniref:Glycosyltransferase n=2 Tax=Flavobacteriaceae TaxID=49546 RepID=A0A4Y8AX46_9FLAO|nr:MULTISPECIES: glycosyltransferase family 4 protein [Flavobacteriaceae]TEW76578.1 glycosyltransferase [Gramella jeungdoensis]GGK60797.1 capsular polysaccharide biosynthesis protein [Lutibacter litoralis]
MMKNKTLKILQVFESYPLFYQPYIPPVIEALQKQTTLTIQICAYSGTKNIDANVTILPSYNYRRIFLRLAGLFNPIYKGLSYIGYKAIHDKVTIIHIQHSFLFSKILGLLKMSKSERPKIIITLRGGDTYVKPWIDERWRDFYKNYGDKVDAFIAMSKHQKKYLQKWGISENKIHIIPISFGLKSLAEPKYPNKEFVKIISAYRMCWEKNIEGNLRTIKVLKERGINVQYDIYGDGPDIGQVYYLIDKYGLKKEVNYFGKIENIIFKKKLKLYDFYLQLSHSESFGGVVVEAQSIGVPCIVSNSGGLPEAIIHGETGYCVNTNDIELAVDYIIKLWSDTKLYHSFSTEAIKYVNNNFTVKHEVNKIIKLYSEV